MLSVSGISCEAEGANSVKITFNQFMFNPSPLMYGFATADSVVMNVFGEHPSSSGGAITFPEGAGKDFAYLSEAKGMTLPITVTLTKNA